MINSAFQPHPDSLRLSVFGARCDPTATGLSSFVDMLVDLGLAPEQIAPARGRRARFSLSSLEKVFQAQDAPLLSFALVRESAPAVSFYFVLDPATEDAHGLALTSALPWYPFTDASYCRKFIDRLGPALAHCEIVYGRCHSLADIVRSGTSDKRDSSWEPSTIDEAWWLNWYGRNLVGRIGRDRVLATPASTLIELADGSVLWTTRPSPADFSSEEARIAQARARAHVVGVSFEGELARLIDRSRRLAPVEPDWDPELDAVCSRITANVQPPSQSDLVAQLNAIDVAPVNEFVAAATVTADVEDAALAVDEYGMYAEQLIALVHERIPTIGEMNAEILPDVDAHFWHHNYAERSARDDVERSLIPAVGGYLGELLVRRFGGRWVPRHHLDEAAVLIGDRAWLPFCRARKYLANREGAVRGSLTKLVRAVEAAHGL